MPQLYPIATYVKKGYKNARYLLDGISMTGSLWWFSPLKINENGNDLLPSAHKVYEIQSSLFLITSSTDNSRIFEPHLYLR